MTHTYIVRTHHNNKRGQLVFASGARGLWADIRTITQSGDQLAFFFAVNN